MATDDREDQRPPVKRPPTPAKPPAPRPVTARPVPIADRIPVLRRRTTAAAAVVLVVLAAVAGVLVVFRGTRPATRSATVATAPAGPCQTDTASDPGSGHVQDPTYAVNPPSGGDHEPVPAPSGIYGGSGPVPRDGQLVHSLEHGYVVVWYRSGLTAADITTLANTVAPFSRDVLLVPRTALPVRVAATAWHQRLLCDDVDSAKLADFIDTYRNKGPERIPH